MSKPSSVVSFALMVCAGLVVGAAIPCGAATYPLETRFDSPAYTLGDLNGQNGWLTVNEVTVQNSDRYVGSQAVLLTSESLAQYPVDLNTDSEVWVSAFCKTSPDGSYPDLPAPAGASCFLFFDATDGITCLDGDGSGSGSWVTTGIDVTTWTRVAIRQDYVTHTWDLWVNSSEVLTGLGNAYTTASRFEKFECQAGQAGPMWFDYFQASPLYLGDGARLSRDQVINVESPDGDSGVGIYDFGSGSYLWQDSSDPSYQLPYTLPYHSWVGLFVYNYSASAWQHAAYPYRDDW